MNLTECGSFWYVIRMAPHIGRIYWARMEVTDYTKHTSFRNWSWPSKFYSTELWGMNHKAFYCHNYVPQSATVFANVNQLHPSLIVLDYGTPLFTFPASLRLGWEWLTVTNPLAFYATKWTKGARTLRITTFRMTFKNMPLGVMTFNAYSKSHDTNCHFCWVFRISPSCIMLNAIKLNVVAPCKRVVKVCSIGPQVTVQSLKEDLFELEIFYVTDISEILNFILFMDHR